MNNRWCWSTTYHFFTRTSGIYKISQQNDIFSSGQSSCWYRSFCIQKYFCQVSPRLCTYWMNHTWAFLQCDLLIITIYCLLSVDGKGPFALAFWASANLKFKLALIEWAIFWFLNNSKLHCIPLSRNSWPGKRAQWWNHIYHNHILHMWVAERHLSCGLPPQTLAQGYLNGLAFRSVKKSAVRQRMLKTSNLRSRRLSCKGRSEILTWTSLWIREYSGNMDNTIVIATSSNILSISVGTSTSHSER